MRFRLCEARPDETKRDKSTIIIRNFKSPHSVADRKRTQEISKSREDWTNTINQPDLTDIYDNLPQQSKPDILSKDT